MEKVGEDYEISVETCLLLPSFDPHFHTIVIELHRTLYIKKTPLQIIKAACLQGGSTYDGRRKTVSYLMGIKKKVPIPICTHTGLFMFATHAVNHYECVWVSMQHVRSYKAHPNVPSKVLVTLLNGYQIELNISYPRFHQQMTRTIQCIYMFRGRFDNPYGFK